VELRSDLFEVLERLSRGRDAGESVLLSPRAREPLRPDRLSKIARTALIRGGMDDVTLRSLRMDCQLRAGGEAQVVRYVQQNGYVTATALAELLGVSKKTAFARLKLLLRRGKLTRVGIRYYLPGTVVPADRQCGAVLAYLHQTGGAYRGDITELLHIGSSQCSLLLRRMVADGEICHEKQRYYIKDA
jgi:Mn-dependent DtxR family transcriptional regulator